MGMKQNNFLKAQNSTRPLEIKRISRMEKQSPLIGMTTELMKCRWVSAMKVKITRQKSADAEVSQIHDALHPS